MNDYRSVSRRNSQFTVYNSQFTIPATLLALLILAYAVYFGHLTLTRYAAFESRALDMGNMDQAIWNTARGNWFHLTNQPGTVNRLSLHVEPILIPISWLYWVYSGPQTLLVLQAVVVALGALPTFALARREVGNAWLALLFALTFLLNPSIQAANWLEFHPLTLAPTFILAAFYFLRTNQPGWFTLFAVLTIACKEEMALLVFMLGIYALVILRRPRWGVVTMLGAVTWAFLAVFVIQNLFAAGNIHWDRYGYLGENPGQMVLTLLKRPDVVLGQFQSASALTYVARLLLPIAFLGILAPEVLLLALPSLGINLLADFPPMHAVSELIYAAPIVPFITAAGIMGTRRLITRLHATRHAPRATGLFGVTILACMLINQFGYGYLPGSGNYRAFTVSDHDRRAANIIAQIPPHAKVSAQDRLNPHVSGRETVYIFPRVEDADTIFLDVTGPAWPQHPNDLRLMVDSLLANEWGIAAAEDGYLLLRKGERNQIFPDAFYRAWRAEGFTPSQPRMVDFAMSLRLIDWHIENDEHGEVVAKLFWQPLQPITQEIGFHVAYLDKKGNELHSTRFYPPTAALWYPTVRWLPNSSGTPIVVQTLPWTLDAAQFTLVVGLYTGNTWETGTPLPITSVDPPLPQLEGGRLVRLGGYQRTKFGSWTAISPTQTMPAITPPAIPLDARFGESAILDGATIAQSSLQAGDILRFTLHWHAIEPLHVDYTTYVHLRNPEDQTVAQLDWQPHDELGPLPTSAWLRGQPVVDRQEMALPEDLAPGDYRLILGVYRWQDGLITIRGSGRDVQPGDIVELAQIQISN